MTLDLSGRVALITGPSSGIGEATARTEASLGASVAINGRRADRLQALVADLGAAVLVVEGDLTDRAVAQRVVDTVVERFGCESLRAKDIADAIGCVVTRPRRVSVNEIMIRPTNQPF